jgi:hypothetical protein
MSNSLLLLGNKYLHPLVYFVADQPSNKNLSPSVPMVGTDSYRRLLVWCGAMDIDVTRVRFYNQADDPFNNPLTRMTINKAVELGQIKVIALGQKAADYLAKVGVDEYFVLPHPSSRNRLLNDVLYVKEKLGACRSYIYGQTKKEDLETESAATITPEQSSPGQEEV